MNSFGQLKRFFSSSSSASARAYRSVVNRKVKVQPTYQPGDLKPQKIYIPKEAPAVPTYPYGPSRIFKRSNRGLFGGQVIMFGNKVSEFGNRTRRRWLPNVITKSIWSEGLGKMIKGKLTARVLRTIKKEGGLDNYLLKDKAARIKELGPYGWDLRYRILKNKEKEAAKQRKNYQEITVPGENSSERNVVKVYYEGTYNGKEVQLIVGRRKLIQRLFRSVQYNTPGDLSFAAYNNRRRKSSFDELLKEMEEYQVNIDDLTLNVPKSLQKPVTFNESGPESDITNETVTQETATTQAQAAL